MSGERLRWSRRWALFEEGAKLLRECTAQLDKAEQKVSLLIAGEDGQPQERPFAREE